jgi:hypothetical protein
MRAGIATRDITPPIGTSLSGFGHGRISTALRDRLGVTALALVDDSGAPAVFVATDLLAMTAGQIAAVHARVRSVVSDSLLVITHSHTHSGPSIGLLRDTQVASDEFLRRVVDSVASVVLEAVATAAPACVFLGSTLCEIGVNRRLPTPRGIELSVHPDGPCDRDVVVVRVERKEGVPIACWFRMSAHPVTLGSADTRISGDWPGEAARLLTDSLGCEALFSQGCCGDVDPIASGSEHALLHVGRLAATAVEQAWDSASPLEPGQWRSVLRVVDLPTNRPPAEDELPARLEIQAIRLGQLAIIGLSAEPFTRIAAWVRGLVPGDVTPLVLGYTNGCFGYLPDDEGFEETEGRRGYEVDFAPWWFRTPILTPNAIDAAKAAIADAVSALPAA